MTANHSHGAGTAIADTSLVRIEDKEDVIALKQAQRETDDEFDEEAIAA